MTDIQLRWYQTESAQALYDAVHESVDGELCHPIAVVPTAGGKTIIMCEFIDKFLTNYPRAKVLVLSHVKEILEQDFDALENYFTGINIGLYSAGLGMKDAERIITVAGIQSIYRTDYTDWDIIVIDECHRITTKHNGMYRKFLGKINGNYVGLTATHFRLGHGYIHKGEGALFNKIAYDLSSVRNFNRLVDEGYLTRLITKATIMRFDTNGLNTRAGDFITKEMSMRFDRDEITKEACDEIIEFGENYKKWLIFAIDIKHAEHIQKVLKKRGISTACVHSKMEEDRDVIVKDFKKGGKYRAIVNVDILTTGFDVPDIDLIAMLRPTESPVIHVQAIGRGLRIAPGKDHCLVLDFACNTSRLGPINDVTIKQYKKGGSGEGPPVVKECPNCMALVPPAVRVCPVCKYQFPIKTSLKTTASTDEIVRTVGEKPEWIKVDKVLYSIHRKYNKPDSLKVTYMMGFKTVSEWICLEHGGYPARQANNWVRHRWSGKIPNKTSDLFYISDQLRKPEKILVNLNEKYPRIQDSVLENNLHNAKQMKLDLNNAG